MGCARCDDLPVRGVLCESIESRLQKRGVGLRGWSSVEGSSLLAAGGSGLNRFLIFQLGDAWLRTVGQGGRGA